MCHSWHLSCQLSLRLFQWLVGQGAVLFSASVIPDLELVLCMMGLVVHFLIMVHQCHCLQGDKQVHPVLIPWITPQDDLPDLLSGHLSIGSPSLLSTCHCAALVLRGISCHRVINFPVYLRAAIWECRC